MNAGAVQRAHGFQPHGSRLGRPVYLRSLSGEIDYFSEEWNAFFFFFLNESGGEREKTPPRG